MSGKHCSSTQPFTLRMILSCQRRYNAAVHRNSSPNHSFYFCVFRIRISNSMHFFLVYPHFSYSNCCRNIHSRNKTCFSKKAKTAVVVRNSRILHCRIFSGNISGSLLFRPKDIARYKFFRPSVSITQHLLCMESS